MKLALLFTLSTMLFAQTDAPGITVDSGGRLLHRPAVLNPSRGTTGGLVVLEATIDATGEVTDARVISGPEHLRKGALTSVLQWHYAADPAPPVSTRISVQFTAHDALPVSEGGRRPVDTEIIAAIQFTGLNPDLEERVRERLPVRQGDRLDADSMQRIAYALRPVDEHLIATQSGTDSKTTLRISLSSDPNGQRIRVAGNVQASNILKKVNPTYPSAAKAARIQGTASFTATIGRDGSIIDLQTISGHPLLVDASADAVRQWTYKPTLLNGQPVEVVTQIDVNYTLQQ